MAKALLSHLHGLRAMRESSRGLTVKSSFICHSTRYCEKRNCHLKAKNLKDTSEIISFKLCHNRKNDVILKSRASE